MTTSPPSSDCFSRMAGICNGFTLLSSVYQKNQKSGGINSFTNWAPNESHHSANERGFHRLLHKRLWAVILLGCALSRLRFADRPYSWGFETVGALYERPLRISCAKPFRC